MCTLYTIDSRRSCSTPNERGNPHYEKMSLQVSSIRWFTRKVWVTHHLGPKLGSRLRVWTRELVKGFTREHFTFFTKNY